MVAFGGYLCTSDGGLAMEACCQIFADWERCPIFFMPREIVSLTRGRALGIHGDGEVAEWLKALAC